MKSVGSSLTAFQYLSNSGRDFFLGEAGFVSGLSFESEETANFLEGVSSLFSEVGELGSYSPSAVLLRLPVKLQPYLITNKNLLDHTHLTLNEL